MRFLTKGKIVPIRERQLVSSVGERGEMRKENSVGVRLLQTDENQEVFGAEFVMNIEIWLYAVVVVKAKKDTMLDREGGNSFL